MCRSEVLVRQAVGTLLLSLLLSGSPLAVAEIVDVEVLGHMPVAQGKAFGDVGAYEYIHGRVTGSLDASSAQNQVIHNLLESAAKAGSVTYTADFAIMRPVKQPAGAARLLVEAPNRGRKYLLQMLNASKPPDSGSAGRALSPEASLHPVTERDAGNEFLLQRGYTLAWIAWESVGIPEPRMSADFPIAKGLKSTVSEEFVLGSRTPRDARELQLSYSVLEPASVVVTVRQDQGDTPALLPESSWSVRNDMQAIVADEEGDGFHEGRLYSVEYPAADPPVLGVGFAAVRDFVSLLRYGDEERMSSASREQLQLDTRFHSVTGIGFSQPARFLRDFLELGMNTDQQQRPVFDGLMIYTAGVGKSLANMPFGTPFRSNTRFQDHQSKEFRPPYAYSGMRQTEDGKAVALTDLADAPLIMDINTSSEYRNKGASLLHTNASGTRDRAQQDTVRRYALAGVQHNARPGMTPKKGKCSYLQNPNNPAPVIRALLVAMTEWIETGRPPPGDTVGRIADRTLVSPDQVRFPKIPDVRYSSLTNGIPAVNNDARARVLVPEVDTDGNEIAGIRTPDIAVPLATHTGWNFYGSPYPRDQSCHMYGAYFPFAQSKEQRLQSEDIRPAVLERYPSQSDYVKQVEAAAHKLQSERLLLPEDVQWYRQRAQRMTFPP